MGNKILKIADEFSDTPGSRYKSEGDYSGEEFRESILIPEYKKAVEHHTVLEIDFDGCYGFATSFLEESFGGLVRQLKVKGCLNYIRIISNDDDTLEGLVRKYVEQAEEKL